MLRVAISSTTTVHHAKTYLTADFEAEITGKFEAEGVRDVKGDAIETLRAHFRKLHSQYPGIENAGRWMRADTSAFDSSRSLGSITSKSIVLMLAPGAEL